MKNPSRKPFAAFLTAGLLAACLASCLVEDQKTAGGATDVPNYLAALGPLAMGYVHASSEWGPAQSQVHDTLTGRIPMGPPQTGSPVSPGIPKSGALSKGSAAGLDSIRWDYADSALGLATAYRHVVSVPWENWDTSLVRYDEKAKAGDYAGAFFLRTRGRGQFNFLAEVTHRYVAEDTDSDGVLDRRSNIVGLKWWGKTEQETWYTLDHPGKDADFQSGDDNPVERIEKVVTLGADTLMHEYLEDRDGDGTIWPMSLAGIDSSRFLYLRAAPGAPGSGVKRGEIEAVVVVFDSSILRPMEVRRARLRNHDFTGAIHSVGLRGFRADSTYLDGDSLDIVLAHAFPAPDSVASQELAFRVRTSPGFGGQDSLVHVRAEATLRRGPIAEARFLFRPDAPLAAGAVSEGGTVILSATLVSGDVVALEGRYEAGRLTAEITEAGGEPYIVVWDRDGKLLQGP